MYLFRPQARPADLLLSMLGLPLLQRRLHMGADGFYLFSSWNLLITVHILLDAFMVISCLYSRGEIAHKRLLSRL